MRVRAIGSSHGKPPRPMLLLFNRVGAVSAIFILLAFAYSALIISDQVAEKAKIQENALLAGLVEENWRNTGNLNHVLNGLRTESATRSRLREYIVKNLVEMGVEASRQHFSTVPSSFLRSNSTSVSGENLYAIVRPFRATPSEAILLAVPLSSSHIESIAVALAFTNYAKRQTYWARDLIFLFVDGGDKLAAEAWFSAYHGYAHPFLKQQGNDLELHGGTIIGAFALDLIGDVFSHVDIHYGMLNGKLPNMDLFSLFVLLVEKTGSIVSLNGVTHQRGYVFDYNIAAKTVVRGVLAQGLTEVESLTAVAGRYGVHAVTLSARGTKASEERGHSTILDLADMVHLVEGGMRSLNNLLEKLHHSYLLYILVTPHHFVSVACYMPLMGLLLTPLLILALREWFLMGGASQLRSVGPALFKLSLSHLLALGFYGLQLYVYMDSHFSAKNLSLVTLFLPVIISIFCFLIPISSSATNLHFARFAIAIELSLFLGSLSLVHFPLALLLSLHLLPQAFSTLLLPSKCAKWKRIFVFLFLHPLFISLLLLIFVSQIYYGTGTVDFKRLWHKLTAQIVRIAFTHFAHGSWLLPIFSGPVLAITSAFNQVIINNDMRREGFEESDLGTDKPDERDKKNE